MLNHSASRALALLRAMNLRQVSSVADLSRETGISKPSIVRLLAILIEDGYVGRAKKPGSYLLTPEVQGLAVGFRSDAAVLRVAGPLLEELTARVHWPVALGFFEQGAMVVRYSTIPSSPLSWYHSTLHQRLPLLGFAMGLLHLAFAEPPVRRALLEPAVAGTDATLPAWEGRLLTIRQRGYAFRLPSAEHPTLSVSVPLIVAGGMVAALSMTLFGRTMTAEEAVRRYLTELRGTAARATALIRSGEASSRGIVLADVA